MPYSHRVLGLLSLVLSLPAGGCYTYASVSPADVALGTTVRVRLSPAAAERLAPALGRDEATVEGQMLERSSDSIAVAVPTTEESAIGYARRASFQRIELPVTDIRDLAIPRLDRVRTGALAVAAAAVVIYAAARMFWTQASASSPNVGPSEQRAPARIVVHVRLPLAGLRLR